MLPKLPHPPVAGLMPPQGGEGVEISKPKVPNATQEEKLIQAKGAEGASALPPGNAPNPSEEPPAHPGPLGIIKGFFIIFFSTAKGKGLRKENLGSSGKKLQVREVLTEKQS